MKPTINIHKKNTAEMPILITYTSGDPVDLTGGSIFFTVKRCLADTDESAIIKKDITIHSSPTTGESVLSLASSDTDKTPGKYVYDLTLVSASGEIQTTDIGEFNILQPVTRRVS